MRRRTSFLILGFFAAGATAQVAACGGDDSSNEQPGADSGGPDVAQTTDTGSVSGDCFGPLPVMTVRAANGTQQPADWSCYLPGDAGPGFYDLSDGGDGGDSGDDGGGAVDAGGDTGSTTTTDAGTDAAADDGGAPVDAGPNYRVRIVDFSSGVAPTGSTVELLWGASTEGDASFVGTVDDAGMLYYPPPPTGTLLLSYRLHASSDELAIYWHGAPVIPPTFMSAVLGNGEIEGNSVSTQTNQTLITSVFGSETPDESLAELVTATRDCQGRDVQGAQVELIDGTTGQPIDTTGTSTSSPRAFYFIDDVPNTKCTYTNNVARAVWSMANAPVNNPGSTHPYLLRMSGRMTASDTTAVTVYENPVELYSGSVTVARPYIQSLPAPNAP